MAGSACNEACTKLYVHILLLSPLQSIADRAATHPPGQRPLAAEKLAEKVAAGAGR